MTHNELLLFGARVRESRNSASLTQEQIANKIGIGLRFYQMIERGEKSISLDTLVNLVKVLQVSIDYLLLGDIANHLVNPVIDIWGNLTSSQRDDATKILKLYYKACHDRPIRSEEGD